MPSKRYRLPQVGFFQGFEAAARNLSFTKAAEELFLTQSAVSRQIKTLEDHRGLKLFERRPRVLVLTESGQALPGRANRARAVVERDRAPQGGQPDAPTHDHHHDRVRLAVADPAPAAVHRSP